MKSSQYPRIAFSLATPMPVLEPRFVPRVKIDGLIDYKIENGWVTSSYFRMHGAQPVRALYLDCLVEVQLAMRRAVVERLADWEAARRSH